MAKQSKEELAARKRRYYLANRKRLLDIQKKNNCERKSEIKTYMAQYYVDNKEKLNAQSREWSAHRRKTDVDFRLREICRARIHFSVTNKSESTIDLIGCSIHEYRINIENQFQDGMSWDNWGEWHIDHIQPVSSFDLSSTEGQKQAFNWKNTQPLWAKENLIKGSKTAHIGG